MRGQLQSQAKKAKNIASAIGATACPRVNVGMAGTSAAMSTNNHSLSSPSASASPSSRVYNSKKGGTPAPITPPLPRPGTAKTAMTPNLPAPRVLVSSYSPRGSLEVKSETLKPSNDPSGSVESSRAGSPPGDSISVNMSASRDGAAHNHAGSVDLLDLPPQPSDMSDSHDSFGGKVKTGVDTLRQINLPHAAPSGGPEASQPAGSTDRSSASDDSDSRSSGSFITARETNNNSCNNLSFEITPAPTMIEGA